MAKIAVIVDEGFEDSEYFEPVKAFQDAGYEIVNIGLKEGAAVTGKNEGRQVQVDLAVPDADPDSFEALLIPGGYSPDHLRAHPDPVSFTRTFFKSGKPVFSICHGPQLLISADVLRDKTLTGYRSISQDIKNAGAKFVDEEVVIDGNLVTSRNPQDLPAFCRACLDILVEKTQQ